MTNQERQGLLVVGSLFVTLFLVFGSGYNTAGVFFTPLLKQFHWSRARLSTIQGMLALAAGLSVPLVGWLLDKIEARIVMVAGVALSGLGFVIASQIHFFVPILFAYFLLGVGIAASTLLPCSLVVANWFGARRGLALGLTMAGTSTGGMVMTLVANRAISVGGWRAGYLTLAAPMFFIVIPLVITMVRTRPPRVENLSVAQAADMLPGLEVAAALRGRSFWMVSVAQFCFALAASGLGLHLITYLIGIGYRPASAALAMSLVFGATSVGKLGFGFFADRVSGRIALSVSLTAAAAGLMVLLGARQSSILALFVLVYGLTLGAPLVLIPVVMVESLGLKRFGTLSGLSGLLNTAGAAIGPVIAGRIFDMTASYAAAFELFAALLVVGACATLACLPLGHEASQAERVAAPA